MGFWIFMLFMDLVIPLTMILFGNLFAKKAPKEINPLFGYRTNRSMKNRDTWEFAHKQIGKIWFLCGMVLLPVSVIPMCFVVGKEIGTVSALGLVICMIQTVLIVLTIIPVEIALRRTFDEDGRRR